MGGAVEYAPQALHQLFDRVKQLIPSAQMGGILGDKSHTYGYHRARNVLPASDYSVTQALDRQGDGWAASALDVTLGSGSVMHTVSQRLLNARNDGRMAPIREFFGSTDGKRVIGWDWSGNCPTSSDDMSHLWHVHLSVHRKYANDYAALAGVAEVMAGVGHSTSGGSNTPLGGDMPLSKADIDAIGDSLIKRLFMDYNGKPRQTVNLVTQALGHYRWQLWNKSTPTIPEVLSALHHWALDTKTTVDALAGQVAALSAKVDELAAKPAGVEITPSDVPVTGTLHIGGQQ